MAKTRGVDIQFPSGGENRRGSYAQREAPFTTPRAKNVRSFGPLERRGRGGSRPMLAKYVNNDFGGTITAMSKVAYLDGSGNLQEDLVVIADGNMNIVQGASVTTTISYLSINGDTVTINGDDVIFTSTVASVSPVGPTDAFEVVEHGGKLYIASSVLQEYNPATGAIRTVQNAPTAQPLVTVYQERIVVSGVDHVFYMSRQGDFEDWDFGADYKDPGRAIAGLPADSGIISGQIKAQVSWRDSTLIFGTDDETWAMYGNILAGGRAQNVSRHSGIIGNRAATVTPEGILVSMARDGLYAWPIGSQSSPEPFSSKIIPEEFRDIDVTSTDVILEYDKKGRGIHIFLTPSSGDGEHWWLDMENRALWPVIFGATTHQPLAIATMPLGGDSDVLLGCQDGYVRRFSNSATNDDGTAVASRIVIGGLHVSGEFGKTGMISKIISDLASGSSAVTWSIFTGNTAEEAIDAATTALEGDGSGYHDTGSWAADHNRPSYPRSRGSWAAILLSSSGRWSYESLRIFIRKLGELR